MKTANFSLRLPFICMIICCELLVACRKDKLDQLVPPLDIPVTSGSSIRMFNMSGLDLDVTVNNILLTSIGKGGSRDGGATALGIALFPERIWKGTTDDGRPFTVPNSLLNKSNQIHLVVKSRAIMGSGSNAAKVGVDIDTVMNDDPLDAKDYYVLSSGKIIAQNRENIVPANPENFKIRIINMGGSNDYLDLNGPIAVTFADGSIVSSKLDRVEAGSASPYIELPYGAYQFKVFVNRSDLGIDPEKQLAELPFLPKTDPCGNTKPIQQNLTVKLRTFKPGGVYTIYVSANFLLPFNCSNDLAVPQIINSYRVLTEKDPGVNTTYAKMQAVNALPGKPISILVDGKNLGSKLPYIGTTAADAVALQTDYVTYIKGDHLVQAVDETGAVIAQKTIKLLPYDNYTIWAFKGADGKADLLFSANDMTGSAYAIPRNVPTDDGVNGAINIAKSSYLWHCRFLNLCAEVPYATFTNDIAPFSNPYYNYDVLVRPEAACVNLAMGKPALVDPNISYNFAKADAHDLLNPETKADNESLLPQIIRVFKSAPATANTPKQVPGLLLAGVKPLNVQELFVANKGLYQNVPKMELGAYTIALIGRLDAPLGSPDQVKMIAIKHNR